jgi:hypothetical protein
MRLVKLILRRRCLLRLGGGAERPKDRKYGRACQERFFVKDKCFHNPESRELTVLLDRAAPTKTLTSRSYHLKRVRAPRE